MRWRGITSACSPRNSTTGRTPSITATRLRVSKASPIPPMSIYARKQLLKIQSGGVRPYLPPGKRPTGHWGIEVGCRKVGTWKPWLIANPKRHRKSRRNEGRGRPAIPSVLSNDHSLGKIMAMAREARGFSREQAAKASNIPGYYLTMIESDDYSSIADQLYLLPFLRRYATFVGARARGGRQPLHPRGATRRHESGPRSLGTDRDDRGSANRFRGAS